MVAVWLPIRRHFRYIGKRDQLAMLLTTKLYMLQCYMLVTINFGAPSRFVAHTNVKPIRGALTGAHILAVGTQSAGI